jgi:TPR repeat protein
MPSAPNDELCGAGCGEVGVHRCTGCLSVKYCKSACHKLDWSRHKKVCKELAAKAKAEAESVAAAAAKAEANTKNAAAVAAAKIEANVEQLRSVTTCKCDAEGCGKPAPLRCIRCLGAFYCGKECQLKAWPDHREPCKAAVESRGVLKSVDAIEEVDNEIARYKRMAESGHPVAQFNLGNSYFHGSGVAVNRQEAIKWYTRAAEQGHVSAQFNLANCYRAGTGVEVNQSEAVKWMKKAAESGDVAAMTNLGTLLALSDTAGDVREKFMCTKRAAETGEAFAMYNLGLCYLHGMGVAINKAVAMKWLTRSAEAGYKPGQIG